MKSDANLSVLALNNVEALAQGESDSEGTLYGNQSGDKYCCCPGTRACSASACSSSICNN